MEPKYRPLMATLAYYGALRWPLTVVELAAHLIPAGRVDAPQSDTDIGTIASWLEPFVASGAVRHESGLYVMGHTPELMADNRIRRQAENTHKWLHVLEAAAWLQAVPYVRMLAASGSLAMGSTGPASDWDVFAVVSAGRLYTARLGLLIASRLMGRLRTKRMRTAPNRFCFNHIITTDGLSIRHRSLFTAQAFSWLVPLYDPFGYMERFRHANRWMSEYVASTGDTAFRCRTVRHSRLLGWFRRTAEFVLSSNIGDIFERQVKSWMLGRINREPVTNAKGGRIVADDRELEFHPHSFEAVALARYNTALTALGLSQFTERDSGLTR